MSNAKNKKPSSHVFHEKGDIIIFALVFMSIFLIMAGGLLGVVKMNRKFTLQKVAQVNALKIAEAGTNYYYWHMAHNPKDYSDGGSSETCSDELPYTCGPYTHDYFNDAGQKIGGFELSITPPPAGSTITNINSTGWIDSFPNVRRSILTRFGIPSLAEYSFLEDSPMIFSATSETWGKIHSNYRIQFNGINHSTVESAEPINGVWGTGGPQDLWHWPVPTVDFGKITQDLALIKDEAVDNGIYFSKINNKKGYHLVLLANNSMDVYEVSSYTNYYFNITGETPAGNYSLENINIIFVEDNIWIEGIVNGLLTIASARFPVQDQTNTSIYIHGNITYATKDPDHVLGLIAQKDIRVCEGVPNETYIDAHLLAQKGAVGILWGYKWPYALRDSLTIYGGIASKTGGGFKYVSGWTGEVFCGFINTYYQANTDAIYHPPPMFPISSTSTVISWEEVE